MSSDSATAHEDEPSAAYKNYVPVSVMNALASTFLCKC